MMAARFCTRSGTLVLGLLLTLAPASAQKSTGASASARPVESAPTSVAAVPAKALSPFRITGRVINSLSETPVGRAEVTVSPMGARRGNGRFAGRAAGPTATATTDAEGRFSTELPSAGSWSVSVSARGYRTQAFEEHNGFSTAVILTEANPVHDLSFVISPAAAIEGYVLDEAGEAARNAQATLSFIPPATPEDLHPRRQVRDNQRTDDRGYYKFSGLLPGSYDVRVQAQPWYATESNGGFRGGFSGVGGGDLIFGGNGSGTSPGTTASSAPDPLDVAYPVVWFPGVTDYANATPIALRGGETKSADFRLLPAPGFHLRLTDNLTSDGGATGDERRPLRNNASLSEVLPDGTEAPVQYSVRTNAGGDMEFSGLAPGTYLIRQQEGAGATIHIAENSARTVDANQASPGVPVSIKVDAAADMSSLQISFRDMESGHVSYVKGQRGSGGRDGRRGLQVMDAPPAALSASNEGPERLINLQPGRYEVTLNGIDDLHLTGIDAKGATATGRTVTIASGAPMLTLHVASGRATVTGFVQMHGKPLEGAMVLLVPATLGDPSGLEMTMRYQINTYGRFDMNAVLPGAYILVAIDHGWDVNWSDPATLRRFLMHGVPLDLSKGGERKVTLQAQSP